MSAACNRDTGGSAAGLGRASRVTAPAPDPPSAVVSGLSRQNSVYRRMMAVCDRLASAAAHGAAAAELTAIFAETAGKTVILLDPEFRPQTRAGRDSSAVTPPAWDQGGPSMTRLFGVLAAERRPLRVPPVPGSALTHGCIATPVIVADDILGYLLVLDETGSEADDADLVTTSYAATLFALTMARERSSLELGRRYQGAVVDALVSGHFLDGEEARRKARTVGIAENQPYRVAVTRAGAGTAIAGTAIAGTGDQGELESAEDLLARIAASAGCAAVIRGAELVMVLPERASLPAGQPDGGVPLTSGVSDLTWLPEHAPQALLQAQHAIDLGVRIGRAGQVISYSELGIYRLLLQIGDMHQLLQFAEDVLGALIDYDARHKLDLVGTLSVYLSQHESLKQTARVLRVHVNTVSYRIQRIEALTSLDLADADHRLSAHVATKIIQSQRAGDARA